MKFKLSSSFVLIFMFLIKVPQSRSAKGYSKKNNFEERSSFLIRQSGNFAGHTDLYRNRVERQEQKNDNQQGEVTNEEVVRQKKLEKERFGEVQYIDLPAEESKEVEEEEIGEVEEESKNKTEEQKRKKEGRKVVKTIKFGVEILGGIAEVGQGIYLIGRAAG